MFLRLRIFEFLFRVFLTVVREFIRRHKATVQASGGKYHINQLSALPRRVLRLPANQIERATTVRNAKKINYIRNGRDTRACLVHQYKDTGHKRRQYVGNQKQVWPVCMRGWWWVRLVEAAGAAGGWGW